MLVDGYTPPTVNIRTVAIYKFHLIAKGVWVVTTIYQAAPRGHRKDKRSDHWNPRT